MYKRCCLAQEKAEQAEAARPAPSDTPVETALRWLKGRFPHVVELGVVRFFALGGETAPPALAELSDGLRRMATVNAFEWLLAEGRLDLNGREEPVREILLAPGGPLFGAEERAWMEAFLSRPLGLYEVTGTVPGERFRVRNLLHPEEAPVWVHDRSASSTLTRWEVLGARLVPWEGGWRASGAFYPLARQTVVPELVRTLREELDEETERDPDRERELLALNPKRGDRLEAFARTRRRADDGRRWLEELAGDAVEHRTREVTDPEGIFAASGGPAGGSGPSPGGGSGRGGASGPFPMTTELMQQILRTQYRTWADDRIPALGGRTPRQAVRTREGREDVVGLLKLYEQGEERAARRDGRGPASFQFLWDAVGLDRSDFGG